MKKCFLMPGLSLSPLIFKKLDFPGYESTFIRWMNPIGNESIEDYLNRLLDIYQIPNHSETVLIGHSLGGIIVQELALRLENVKVILISSIKSPAEIPWKIRFLKHGYAYHLAGKRFIQATIDLWGGYHGYDSDELKDLLLDEVETLNNRYYIWAYKQIIYWDGVNLNRPVYHIHGNMDKTFPIANIQNAIVVSGGDHLMVYKKGTEVNKLIQEAL